MESDSDYELDSTKQGRTWLGVENNPTVDTKEFLKALYEKGKAKYVCGQLEKGEKNGTIHIQYFVNFSKPVRLAALKKITPRANYKLVKQNNGAHNYCLKEKTRIEEGVEFGQKPLNRNNKEDWEEIKEKAKAGLLDEVPADVYIKHYGNLKRIAKDHMVAPLRKSCLGYWYQGPSGTGKTTTAWEKYPGAYPKNADKWWDGYQGEEEVILDDLTKGYDKLGYFLKTWCNIGKCHVQDKGGALPLRMTTMVVTTQYSIEEVFGEDPEMVEAIKKRFKVTHFRPSLMAGSEGQHALALSQGFGVPIPPEGGLCVKESLLRLHGAGLMLKERGFDLS